MVGEFPELQGVKGAYYAQADGEDAETAAAIREHYLPRAAGDQLPVTATGMTLALADRLDTLAGIFAIGQKPSGTRDPFGLRRAAIGVLRIIRERALQFDLRALVEQAVAAQPVADLDPRRAAVCDEVYEFIMERLRAQYLEDPARGVTTEIFDAVLASGPRSPLDADARVRALVEFLQRPEAASLAAANRRIANILKKSAATAGGAIDAQLLRAPAERELHAALTRRRAAVERSQREGNYGAAFAELALLGPEVDAFFEHVLVNDPDTQLRSNRLALLGELRALFAGIADLSRLPG
jgi:glycyl-tRNA synthetase beta chain